MARHYGTSVIPVRPYKPRDKAKVEQSVLLVERWVIDPPSFRWTHMLASELERSV
ncbi:transposase [Phenylobacterium koreense]|uniref:Transposase n=1 Tax=Phenylobacterium koreense TaxID=266125 RepID=A0ABV2ELW5_9CAUL